jgi:hypothetical protein
MDEYLVEVLQLTEVEASPFKLDIHPFSFAPSNKATEDWSRMMSYM